VQKYFLIVLAVLNTGIGCSGQSEKEQEQYDHIVGKCKNLGDKTLEEIPIECILMRHDFMWEYHLTDVDSDKFDIPQGYDLNAWMFLKNSVYDIAEIERGAKETTANCEYAYFTLPVKSIECYENNICNIYIYIYSV